MKEINASLGRNIPQRSVKNGLNLMIVSGEASGDLLGAELALEIRKCRNNSLFFGTTGPKMRDAGVESLFDSDDWSIVGIGAVTRAVPQFLRLKAKLRRSAWERKPDAVILIDFPEFNLKLARALKRDGHRVVFYVSPQLWAWRQYRIRTIRKSVDLLLSILPFEKQWYEERGVDKICFVGNPVAARTLSRTSEEDFRKKHGVSVNEKLIAILPGSRRNEIKRHLRTMLEAAALIKLQYSSKFAIASANENARFEIESIAMEFQNINPLIVDGETVDLLNASDAAMISSGTATLEAGVLGTPIVVIYKVPIMDYHVFKRFVDVPHFSLINLIAGKRIARELIQEEFTAEKLAAELVRLLGGAANEKMRNDLKQATMPITAGNPSANAAEEIVKFLDANSR